jgi:leucyl aminopeptidase
MHQISPDFFADTSADWLIVGVPNTEQWSDVVTQVNDKLGGAIKQLKEQGDLTGKSGESLTIYQPNGCQAKRLLLVGCGDPQKNKLTEIDQIFGPLFRKLCDKPNLNISVLLSSFYQGDASQLPTIVQAISTLAEYSSVDQAVYVKERKRHRLQTLTILTSGLKEFETSQLTKALERGKIMGEAMNLTRDLVNRGPHEIVPISVADRASQIAVEYGLKCQIWDKTQLEKENMGSLLAVAKGSANEARVVMLEYMGNPDSTDIIALVGKGVTFDTGGYCIKPADGMKTMKCDMAGSATVLGAIMAIAQIKPKVNVRAYLGLVENMISGEAFRLGDVLTARNGVTIEVMNTDAEGRLVLADVLCLAVDHGATKLVDVATLTGACVIALGEDVVGLFTNQQEFAQQVLSAAEATSEPMWQLPMFDSFADQLKSDVANCKNVGTRWGGATTAAKFLQKFVSEKPWVHLDIAGPAFAASAKGPREAGATGVMVRTLVNLCENLK